ncbi:MAG TPA: acyl-CoA desaturase [Candidatus Paceibacterota bacterium]
MKREFWWSNAIFFALLQVFGILGLVYLVQGRMHPATIVYAAILYIYGGLSIAMGYHRYFSHDAYKTHPWVEIAYLFGGVISAQASALWWATLHRLHHGYVDKERDPYNATKGFWWSHIGWLLWKTRLAWDLHSEKVDV